VRIAISYKYTMFGAELKLACVTGSQVWPNGTAKSMKEGIIWFLFIEAMEGCIIVNKL